MVTSSGKAGPPIEWAFLLHKLPREPSGPRIALWRSIRRLGAVLLGDGLVALPASSRTVEHLQWLAAEVNERGGSASVWRARPVAERDGDRLVESARAAIDAEYREVLLDAGAPADLEGGDRRRVVRRLRGRLRRVAARDYFGSPFGSAAREAVERLAREVVAV